MLNSFMDATWVNVGDGEMINIDTHIDHFSGADPLNLNHQPTLKMFNNACRLLLTELKRRVDEEGK